MNIFSLVLINYFKKSVAASFRLRNLREIHIYPSGDEKLRLKPEATTIEEIRLLNLDPGFPLLRE